MLPACLLLPSPSDPLASMTRVCGKHRRLPSQPSLSSDSQTPPSVDPPARPSLPARTSHSTNVAWWAVAAKFLFPPLPCPDLPPPHSSLHPARSPNQPSGPWRGGSFFQRCPPPGPDLPTSIRSMAPTRACLLFGGCPDL